MDDLMVFKYVDEIYFVHRLKVQGKPIQKPVKVGKMLVKVGKTLVKVGVMLVIVGFSAYSC